VTGPGWLGPAQPIWAELDLAQKKIKNKKIKTSIYIYICMHKK
jgi:hypothetical protein